MRLGQPLLDWQQPEPENPPSQCRKRCLEERHKVDEEKKDKDNNSGDYNRDRGKQGNSGNSSNSGKRIRGY